MSSDEDGVQLMAAFKSAGPREAAPPTRQSSHSAEESGSEDTLGSEEDRSQVQTPLQSRRAVCVRAKPANKKDEFVYYEAIPEVEEILRSYPGKKVLYDVRMYDQTTKQVSAFGKGGQTESRGNSKSRAGEAPGLLVSVYIICLMHLSAPSLHLI
jgi:hypothetical protein